jgi:transposase
MMTQNDLVVVGIDVAKDKVDACIRTVTERRTFPTTASGRRSLIAWLRKHQVGKAVMEASGGYERVWAKAPDSARSANCRSKTGSQLRGIGWTPCEKR